MIYDFMTLLAPLSRNNLFDDQLKNYDTVYSHFNHTSLSENYNPKCNFLWQDINLTVVTNTL